MNQRNGGDLTRERILETAEILFAQKGYQAVSVREITSAAECNLAAVNYHFGNTENLYLEVFRSPWVPRAMRLRESFRKYLASQDSLSESAVVRALAQSFVNGPLSDDERLRHAQLMTREITRLTKAFEDVAEQVMQPFFNRDIGAVGFGSERQGGRRTDVAQRLQHLRSGALFNFARVAVSRLTGRKYDPACRALLAEQISRFSLRGLGAGNMEELG